MSKVKFKEPRILNAKSANKKVLDWFALVNTKNMNVKKSIILNVLMI